MNHDKWQNSSVESSKHLHGVAGAYSDDAETAAELGSAEIEALLTDMPKSVQILEDLFQAFEVDPQLARDLGTATVDLMEEELGASDGQPPSPSNRALLDELAGVRAQLKRGVH